MKTWPLRAGAVLLLFLELFADDRIEKSIFLSGLIVLSCMALQKEWESK